jgi:cytosine/adenosine deaminase-related metal-dependent hydrolase
MTPDQLRASAEDPDRRLLIAGATVLTMDAELGDLAIGDVLVHGDRIEAIGPDLSQAAADGQALRVDAAGMIVLPGFQDTHRHCWQGQFRRFMCSCDIAEYMVTAHDVLAPAYTPDDVYAGCLLSAWGALDAGITTVLDFMHNARTLDHSLAAIAAFDDTGIRGVHGAGPPSKGEWDHLWLEHVRELREDRFASDDQLLTLRLAPFGYPDIDQPDKTLSAELLAFARELGLGTTVDAVLGPRAGDLVAELGAQGLLGPDLTLIHCTELTDAAWTAIAASGTEVALAPTSDAQLGIHDALPPLQRALDHGIRPGLSVDVECSLSSDMFAQMQALCTIQRMQAFGQAHGGDATAPAPILPRELLELATVDGARVNGLAAKAGTLTPGKQADLIAIGAEDINTMPLNSAAATVVLGADSRNVHLVLVAGRARKIGGELVGCDADALRRRVHASRDGLLERTGLTLDVLA